MEHIWLRSAKGRSCLRLGERLSCRNRTVTRSPAWPMTTSRATLGQPDTLGTDLQASSSGPGHPNSSQAHSHAGPASAIRSLRCASGEATPQETQSHREDAWSWGVEDPVAAAAYGARKASARGRVIASGSTFCQVRQSESGSRGETCRAVVDEHEKTRGFRRALVHAACTLPTREALLSFNVKAH